MEELIPKSTMASVRVGCNIYLFDNVSEARHFAGQYIGSALTIKSEDSIWQ